jgi:hypothetical protein
MAELEEMGWVLIIFVRDSEPVSPPRPLTLAIGMLGAAASGWGAFPRISL